MSTRSAPRLRTAVAAALSLWLALALTPLAGSSEPAQQIGYVRGRLVHLRNDVPQHYLEHDSVLRHLTPGEVFVTDGVRSGVSYTGTGSGAWFHVRRLNDPTESGWISEKYLVLIPGAYLTVNTQESLETINELHEASKPAVGHVTVVKKSRVHTARVKGRRGEDKHPYVPKWVEKLRKLFAPVADFVSDVFSILDNVVNLLTLLLTVGIGRLLMRFLRLKPVPVAAVALAAPTASLNTPEGARKPNHLYFDGFYVSND